MANRVTQQNKAGKVRMRNRILSIIRNTIPYVKELRNLPFVKSTNGCILMQQLDYWFTYKPEGFYKFLAPPAKSHPAYKKGDSWTEELGFSKDEFRTAFDSIGIRYETKGDFFKVENKFEFFDEKLGEYREKYYCSYTDKMQHMTYYFRNHALVDAELAKLQFPEVEDTDFSSSAMAISTDGDSQSVRVGGVNPDYTETTTETTSNNTYKEREQPAYAGSRSQDDIGLEEGENLHRKSSPPYDEVIDAEPVFEDEPVAAPPLPAGKAVPLPQDFQLTEAMRAWAAANFPTVNVELATMKFVNTRREQGRKSKNWVVDWQNYIISWANNERKNAPARYPNVWERRKEMLMKEQEEDLFPELGDDGQVDFVKLSERLFGQEEDLFADVTD